MKPAKPKPSPADPDAQYRDLDVKLGLRIDGRLVKGRTRETLHAIIKTISSLFYGVDVWEERKP